MPTSLTNFLSLDTGKEAQIICNKVLKNKSSDIQQVALVNNNNMQTINQNISDRWDIQETVNIYSDILIVFRIKLMKAGAKADLRLTRNLDQCPPCNVHCSG